MDSNTELLADDTIQNGQSAREVPCQARVRGAQSQVGGAPPFQLATYASQTQKQYYCQIQSNPQKLMHDFRGVDRTIPKDNKQFPDEKNKKKKR
jgi:hypothetical protein